MNRQRKDGVLTQLLDKECFYLLTYFRGRSGITAQDMEMKSEITSVLQLITKCEVGSTAWWKEHYPDGTMVTGFISKTSWDKIRAGNWGPLKITDACYRCNVTLSLWGGEYICINSLINDFSNSAVFQACPSKSMNISISPQCGCHIILRKCFFLSWNICSIWILCSFSSLAPIRLELFFVFFSFKNSLEPCRLQNLSR